MRIPFRWEAAAIRGTLAATAICCLQLSQAAHAEAQFGTARVTFWSSDCPAAELQLLDTGHGQLPFGQWRTLNAYLVIDDTRADDGVNALENADVVQLELDSGISTIQTNPIALLWTGQFIGISNGEPDTRPTPLLVSTQAVGPFTASEAEAVLGARCRALASTG
jgi:hypothetical protein